MKTHRSPQHGTRWTTRAITLAAFAAGLAVACDKSDATATSSAPASAAATTAPSPSTPPAATTAAAPPAAPAATDHPACPPNSTWTERPMTSKDLGITGCESTGKVRMAELKLKGPITNGAVLTLTNKSPYPIVGNVRVYAYDATGKQLEIFSPGHSAKGDKWLDCGFSGTMTPPGGTHDIDCLTKDIMPAGARTIEGELTRATWHINDDSVAWDNPSIGPNDRPMGGIK